MNLTISFKNMKHTPSLDMRIREKSSKFKKFMDGKLNVKWTCYVKNNRHCAEVDIYGSQFDYHAKANSDSLYKTLDLVIGKVEKQLYKRKNRWKDKLHRKKVELVIQSPDDVWELHDEDHFDDIAA